MESQNETQRIGAVIVAKSGRLSKERGRERRNVKAAIAIQSPKDSNDVDKRKKTNASVRNRTLYERECFNFIEKTSTQKASNRRGAKEDTGREGKKSENANESVPAKRKQRQRCQGLRERKRSKRRETVVLPQQRMNFIRDPLTLTSGN